MEDLRFLIDDHAEPECPFCNLPASGEMVAFGGHLLHTDCHDELGQELAILGGDGEYE